MRTTSRSNACARNKQLTPDDLVALTDMLLANGIEQVDVTWATEQGLGLFIHSLVGLDHAAATEAFGRYLDGGHFTVHQIRFVDLIVNELTVNGIMEPGRLYESPYVDDAANGPDSLFPETDVDGIVGILRDVIARARPAGVA